MRCRLDRLLLILVAGYVTPISAGCGRTGLRPGSDSATRVATTWVQTCPVRGCRQLDLLSVRPVLTTLAYHQTESCSPPSLRQIQEHRPHRPIVVRPRAVPKRQVRVGAKIDAALFGPFAQEHQGVFACLPGRYRRQGATIRRGECQFAVPCPRHRPTTLVNQAVMVRAQQRQVVDAGLAPVQPVANVVAVQESIVRAPGETTTAVAEGQCTANCRRNPPLPQPARHAHEEGRRVGIAGQGRQRAEDRRPVGHVEDVPLRELESRENPRRLALREHGGGIALLALAVRGQIEARAREFQRRRIAFGDRTP